MGDGLPSSFDAIVVGTGLTESIVAAALSRIGKSVLHIDRNAYYGSRWSSFSLRSLQNWAETLGFGENLQQVEGNSTEEKQQQQQQQQKSPPVDTNSLLQDGEASLTIPRSDEGVSNVHLSYNHIFKGGGNDDKTCENGTVECQVTSKPAEGAQDGEEPSECPEQQQQQQQQSGNDNEGKEEKSPHAECPADTEEAATKDRVLEIDDQLTAASAPENKKSTPEHDTNKRPEDQKVDEESLQQKTGQSHPKRWTVDEFEKQWRRFNFDLAPRVLYSSGDMVRLLIQSDISRYCEFKLVSRILTIHDDQVQCVPCSRAHVFNSKAVTMLDKRMMMKFVKICLGEETDDLIEEYADKPFTEYLSKKFSPIVKHYIYKAITMTKENTSTTEGIALAKKFFSSVGHYGNLPFITPIYGVGELPQAFSRMCAVWGGIYCLNLSVDSILTNNDKVTGIITNEGQRIECKHLIMEPSYLPENMIKSSDAQIISRAILVTDRALMQSGKEELSVLNAYPPDDPERSCIMLEFPASAMVCPSGLSVVHLTRIGKSDPKSDLDYMCQFLFDFDPNAQAGPHAEPDNEYFNDNQESSKPKVLWSFFFQMKSHQNLGLSQDAPSNLYATSQPGLELDLDFYPKEARAIFQAMYPTEEFHPKCPNPEDIIYAGSEGEENKTEETSTKEDDSKDDDKSSAEGNIASGDEKSAEVNVEGVEPDLAKLKLDEDEKKSDD